MRYLKSLIFDAAKGFMPDVYLEKVDVYSIVDGIEVFNSYNLSEVMFGGNTVNLLDRDNGVDSLDVFTYQEYVGPLICDAGPSRFRTGG